LGNERTVRPKLQREPDARERHLQVARHEGRVHRPLQSIRVDDASTAPDALAGRNTVMPWLVFSHMTDQDLGAIYVYLKNVKPIENKVVTFSDAKYARTCVHLRSSADKTLSADGADTTQMKTAISAIPLRTPASARPITQ
jgi:hypothetical protein